MMYLIKIRSVLGIALVGASSLVMAQAVDQRFLAQNIFKTADTNGDGEITPQESDVYLKSTFRVIDANGDGVADHDEFLGFYSHYLNPAPPPQGAEMLFKLDIQTKDANGDGVISEAEFVEHGRKMFRLQDANGDGVLKPGEIQGQAP